MRILFLVYHGFSEHSGISKKIHYQVKGLRENGHEVHLCYYGFSPEGHRCRYIDDEVIKDYDKGSLAGIRQRMDYAPIYDYCVNNGIEFVYARSFQNANPWLVSFFKKLKKAGIKAVTEIPTYPYDQEFKNFPLRVRAGLLVDKFFRNSLSAQMEGIITFSDAEYIFGQRTIRISNGVDFDSIPLHHFQPQDDAIHLIGVAEVHFWHGYDRLMAGLGEYYMHGGDRDVYFHIVGGVHPGTMYNDSPNSPAFRPIIDRYKISDKIIFHGQLFGDELDRVFNQCCFAIGSLARHRSGISIIKTLKNREYATRGIPFIYSEQDSDFDDKPYILKAIPDESPIDVQQILDYIDSHHFEPAEIRKMVEHLTWKIQMQKVLDETFDGTK